MPLKFFKKIEKKPTPGTKSEMIYSMAPRHGRIEDVLDENGVRQVAGCLPIDPINKRFLLISSPSDPDTWDIPKGSWGKDETQKQAAMRETWEEAGVKGSVSRHIGVFAEKSETGVKAHHWIYEMEIKEVTKKFPEQDKRQRRWFGYEEAMMAVKAHYIHDALSMSSLSPLIYEGESKKKKKKKKKKKEKEVNDSPATTDDEQKEKKGKKKKDKERETIEETLSFNEEEGSKKGKQNDITENIEKKNPSIVVTGDVDQKIQAVSIEDSSLYHEKQLHPN